MLLGLSQIKQYEWSEKYLQALKNRRNVLIVNVLNGE